MPLNTIILRDGKPMSLHWGHWHIGCMIAAIRMDNGEDLEIADWVDRSGPLPLSPQDCSYLMGFGYPTIGDVMSHDGYELINAWSFSDPTDGEILDLKPGDRLILYRG